MTGRSVQLVMCRDGHSIVTPTMAAPSPLNCWGRWGPNDGVAASAVTGQVGRNTKVHHSQPQAQQHMYNRAMRQSDKGVCSKARVDCICPSP